MLMRDMRDVDARCGEDKRKKIANLPLTTDTKERPFK